MSLRLLELAIALLLAFGFAAVGELLIGVFSDSLAEWNDSFLAGLGACAALLFPLSLLSPRSALTILLVLLGVSAAAAVARRVSRGRLLDSSPKGRLDSSPKGQLDRSSNEHGAPRDGVAFALAWPVGIALMIVIFLILNLRLPFAWDGFQIWATKAMALHHEGGLRPHLFPDSDYEGRLVGYPNAVPLYEALLSVVRGRFAFEAVKPVFLVFFLSLAVAFHRFARTLLPARTALIALALLLSVPGISRMHNLGGYADMPLAAAVTAAVAACARIRVDRRAARAAPWLIGSLALLKNEGTLLAAAIALFVVAFVALDGLAALRRAWKMLLLGGAVVAGLCLAQSLYVRWTETPDTTYAPVDWAHIANAPRLLPGILGACAHELLDVDSWIFLWPAFLAAALVIAARGSRIERFLAGGCVVVLGGYAAIYLFTNWEVLLHVHNSYPRLAEQIAPIAVVILFAGARRLHAARARESGSLPDQELEVARQEP